MSEGLATLYVRNHPRDAAQFLESSSETELTSFLAGVPLEDTVSLSNYLLPATVAHFLVSLSTDDAAELIEHLRSDTASKVLGTLDSITRRPILEALSLEKRQNVLHRLRYPADSVGSLMLTRTLVCRDDADIRRARAIVRRFADTALAVVTIVDSNMHPVGEIPVSRLVGLKLRDKVKDHMTRNAGTVRAVEAVRTVSALPVWLTSEHLPVVDGEGRYTGLLTKSLVQGQMLASGKDSGAGPDLFEATVSIAEMFWVPAAEMLARATTQREDSNDV